MFIFTTMSKLAVSHPSAVCPWWSVTMHKTDKSLSWCSKLSSGIYCRVKWLSTDVSEVCTASIIPDDGGSTHLWNVGRQSFYMAVYPRRQLWTSYSPPWELEISQVTFTSPQTLKANLLTFCHS
jgi:hypothetical protein